MITVEEFRSAPAFARMCMVQAHYALNPIEPLDPRPQAPEYNRRPKVPLRTRVLPLFASGERLRMKDLMAALPGVKAHSITTTMHREVDAGRLEGNGHSGWKRGPEYPL